MDKPMPDCPKCGNNRQVWRNQVTDLLTCHRLGCNTAIATINTQPHVQPCPCAWCKVDADNLSLAELAAEAEREFDAGKTLPVEQLCQPTREQMCADLARAIGWTQGKASGVWFSPPSAPELCVYDVPPNPFTSAEDSRALAMWLAEDDERWYRYFLVLEKLIDTPRERMGQSHPQGLFYAVLRSFVTADLPIIAEAAWRAIAAERSTDS